MICPLQNKPWRRGDVRTLGRVTYHGLGHLGGTAGVQKTIYFFTGKVLEDSKVDHFTFGRGHRRLSALHIIFAIRTSRAHHAMRIVGGEYRMSPRSKLSGGWWT